MPMENNFRNNNTGTNYDMNWLGLTQGSVKQMCDGKT
jgi:hypothetical protein